MKDYVIITGAYGSLGKKLAFRFARAGYGLVLLGRKKNSLEKLEKSLLGLTEVISVQADVRDWNSCKIAHDQIQHQDLRIKILINNAAITYINYFDETFDIERYKNVIDTNLNGPVYMTRLFIKDLIRNKGSLINISSVLGYAPMTGRTSYVASKFGMEGFSRVVKSETKGKLHLLMVYPTFFKSTIRSEADKDKTVYEVLSAESVANRIFKAFKLKKKKIYIGRTAKLSLFLNKFSPKLYVHLMRRKVGNLS